MTMLNRLIEQAPYISRCSDNKTAARTLPREYAAKQPYMQVNQPGLVSWLVFDLDHPNAWIWQDKDLPEPNIIVTNPKNGSSHLYYAISPVCTTDAGRLKPVRYMRAVYKALAVALDADPSYSGPVAKTPGHPWWKTTEQHTYEYALGDLAKHLTLEVVPFRRADIRDDDIPHSRHCMLFERLRRHAYATKQNYANYSDFLTDTTASAMALNTFREQGFGANLSLSQVKATVKSICRWTWERYTGSNKQRGVMRLSNALSLSTKQALSAKRTHQSRTSITEAKIRRAVRVLSTDHASVTLTLIADFTHLTRQTVAKYKTSIAQELAKLAVPSIQEVFEGVKQCVKYGVHQITTPGGDLGSRFATPLARPSLDGISGFSHAIPPAPQGQKQNKNLKRVLMRAEVESQLRTLASDCGTDPASVSAAVGALHQDIREDSNAD